MNLDALVIDPATQTISALQISVTPHVKTALARIIGRQPKFAWISFRSAIAYDESGGAPAFFRINGSPPLRRKAVVLDFAGGAFQDSSMSVRELAVLVQWGNDTAEPSKARQKARKRA